MVDYEAAEREGLRLWLRDLAISDESLRMAGEPEEERATWLHEAFEYDVEEYERNRALYSGYDGYLDDRLRRFARFVLRTLGEGS